MRTDYARREALPAGISPMHFGRDVVMPKLVLMMMMMMVGVVVVMVVMMIAVLLSMVPRRIRAMNRVGRVGGSQRQRVHPLFLVAGSASHATQAKQKMSGSLGDGERSFLRYRVSQEDVRERQSDLSDRFREVKRKKRNLTSPMSLNYGFSFMTLRFNLGFFSADF